MTARALPALLLLAGVLGAPLNSLAAVEAAASPSLDAGSSGVLADGTVITISGDSAPAAPTPVPAPTATPDIIWYWIGMWIAGLGGLTGTEGTISDNG